MLRATKSGELNNGLQFSVEAIVNGKQVAAGEIVLSAREMTND
jgi:flagellar motor switch/type III secretory pathway protein FliN